MHGVCEGGSLDAGEARRGAVLCRCVMAAMALLVVLGAPADVVDGAGIAPIGLRLDYDGFGCWRPYFATNVGFLMFEDRIPATGTKFNYTWDFGLGTQLFLTDDQAISLGYDFKHISNAY